MFNQIPSTSLYPFEFFFFFFRSQCTPAPFVWVPSCEVTAVTKLESGFALLIISLEIYKGGWSNHSSLGKE